MTPSCLSIGINLWDRPLQISHGQLADVDKSGSERKLTVLCHLSDMVLETPKPQW
jgi:hypothetical protein